MFCGGCSRGRPLVVPVADSCGFLIYSPDLRRKEGKLIEKSGFIQSLSTMMFFTAPTVSTAVMFLVHTGLQLELTASMVHVWGVMSSPLNGQEVFSFVQRVPLKDVSGLQTGTRNRGFRALKLPSISTHGRNGHPWGRGGGRGGDSRLRAQGAGTCSQ